jgi:hypothetical protein
MSDYNLFVDDIYNRLSQSSTVYYTQDVDAFAMNEIYTSIFPAFQKSIKQLELQEELRGRLAIPWRHDKDTIARLCAFLIDEKSNTRSVGIAYDIGDGTFECYPRLRVDGGSLNENELYLRSVLERDIKDLQTSDNIRFIQRKKGKYEEQEIVPKIRSNHAHSYIADLIVAMCEPVILYSPCPIHISTFNAYSTLLGAFTSYIKTIEKGDFGHYFEVIFAFVPNMGHSIAISIVYYKRTQRLHCSIRNKRVEETADEKNYLLITRKECNIFMKTKEFIDFSSDDQYHNPRTCDKIQKNEMNYPFNNIDQEDLIFFEYSGSNPIDCCIFLHGVSISI